MPVPTRLLPPGVELLDDASVHRDLVVKPAMCGHNSLFVGQVGDWTWETVSVVCDTDVFLARNEDGDPTYLAFYYYRVRGSRAMHLRRFGFGDRIAVDSSVFGFGSESVLTLHRIALREDAAPPAPVDPVEFYERPRPECLYVENFNRWITRRKGGGNRGLLRSSPVGFRYAHLPALPEAYSPRRSYRAAREQGTFHDPAAPGWRVLAGDYTVEYPLDISRDVNGVGLVYFASYFSVVDWALLRLWRALGRDDRSFLDRRVVDQRLCYLGNAQLDSVLVVRMSASVAADDPLRERITVAIDDREHGDRVAVGVLELAREEDR